MSDSQRIHLYIATNTKLGEGYIGIGPLGRERDAHPGRKSIDRLLNHPQTEITVTGEAFTTRQDAERAEAAAIRAALSSSRTKTGNHGGLTWLNTSATASSKYLRSLFSIRPGTLHFDDLTSTLVVVIKDGTLQQRVAILEGTPERKRDKRILRWWPQSQVPATRFVAVSKTRKNGVVRVLADYDILVPTSWTHRPDGWVIVRDPASPFDPRSDVGKQFHWCGAHPSNKITMSPDLRRSAGRDDPRRACGHPIGRPTRIEESP